MIDNNIIETIQKLSPEHLRKVITFWNELSPERKAGYFQNNDALIATVDLFSYNTPIQLRLKIIRLNLSMAPHVIAEVASAGLKVSVLAFRITEELQYNQNNIIELVKAYECSYSELCHEIRDV